MGNDDDYGEEGGAGFKREQEADFDFMWVNLIIPPLEVIKQSVNKVFVIATLSIDVRALNEWMGTWQTSLKSSKRRPINHGDHKRKHVFRTKTK
jgi:hypothetical protein